MKIPKELVKGSKWYINFASSTYTIEIVQVWGGNVLWKKVEEEKYPLMHIESIDDFFNSYRMAMPVEVSTEPEPVKAPEQEKPKSWWQMFCERFNADNTYDNEHD